MDPALQRRLVLDEVQPEAGELVSPQGALLHGSPQRQRGPRFPARPLSLNSGSTTLVDGRAGPRKSLCTPRRVASRRDLNWSLLRPGHAGPREGYRVAADIFARHSTPSDRPLSVPRRI